LELYYIYKDKYYETVALNNVNWKIFKNESIAVIGPSGSGKTTLLKILSGLLKATSGRIYFSIDSPRKISPFHHYSYPELIEFRRNYIGYIPQEDILFPHLSVEDNIKIPIEIKNNGHLYADWEQKVDSVLKLCGIEHRREYLEDQLSGGEKQRLQIAMALITDPAIIIADEPTANLDSKNAQNIFSLFQTIQQQTKTTIITVTHDLLIEKYADKVIKIKDGQLKDPVIE